MLTGLAGIFPYPYPLRVSGVVLSSSPLLQTWAIGIVSIECRLRHRQFLRPVCRYVRKYSPHTIVQEQPFRHSRPTRCLSSPVMHSRMMDSLRIHQPSGLPIHQPFCFCCSFIFRRCTGNARFVLLAAFNYGGLLLLGAAFLLYKMKNVRKQVILVSTTVVCTWAAFLLREMSASR